MQYDLVYDASQADYRNGFFPAVGLCFVAVGGRLLMGRWIYLFRRPWARKDVWPEVLRWFGPAAMAVGIAWAGLTLAVTYRDYWRLKSALEAGKFEVVEAK